jgi:hypothetical protein
MAVGAIPGHAIVALNARYAQHKMLVLQIRASSKRDGSMSDFYSLFYTGLNLESTVSYLFSKYFLTFNLGLL